MNNILKFVQSTRFTKAETAVSAILTSTLTDVKKLAEVFDVSDQTIRNIKMLKTVRAKKVAAIMTENGEQIHTWEGAGRFTDEQVAEIRASNETSPKLAKKFGCSPSTIRMVKTGKTYA